MFYEGWGPCPVLPVAPPGAPPAWLLGGLSYSRSVITQWRGVVVVVVAGKGLGACSGG